MLEIQRHNDQRIDELECAISDLTPVDCPVTHIFTPGLYIRQIFMPKGSIITSKCHKTSHPYIISMGAASVQVDMGEWILMEAPYHGITNKGTRRVLYIHTDCIWTTIHSVPYITGKENEYSEDDKETLVKEIEDMILEKHTNNLLINKQMKSIINNGTI